MDEMTTDVLETKQYINVRLDSEQYGIDISYVDNIVRLQQITRVPKAQYFFEGVINLRGEVMPVLSLRKKIGLPDIEDTSSTRIIIIKIDDTNAKLGILVDEVREVVTLDESSIDKAAHDDNGLSLIGVGKYQDTLISLLNIQGLISELDSE